MNGKERKRTFYYFSFEMNIVDWNQIELVRKRTFPSIHIQSMKLQREINKFIVECLNWCFPFFLLSSNEN
jgi:hypothetical protein